MRRLFALLLVPWLTTAATAAIPVLLPSVGLERAPRAGDSICPIPLVDQAFETSGPAIGDAVPDFTLYTLGDDPVSLGSTLAAGRPVLLVAGSLSCPVFRNTIPALNAIAERWRGRLEVLVVYVLEPHPVVDISPYFGVENVTSQNRYADILVRQPRTYEERRWLVDSLLARHPIAPRVVIDGPCNEWWSAYGRAPNNAILVGADGRVAAYHGWFNREPLDMGVEIERYLGDSTGDADAVGAGRFELRIDSSTDSLAAPGSTFIYYMTLTNSSHAGVLVEVSRQESALPDGWSSSICTDVCQPPSVGEDEVYLRAGVARTIAVHIYSDARAGEGRLRMRLRNVDSVENSEEITLGARTVATPASVPEEHRPLRIERLSGRAIRVEAPPARAARTLMLYDLEGRTVAGAVLEADRRSLILGGLPSSALLYVVGESGRPRVTGILR